MGNLLKNMGARIGISSRGVDISADVAPGVRVTNRGISYSLKTPIPGCHVWGTTRFPQFGKKNTSGTQGKAGDGFGPSGCCLGGCSLVLFVLFAIGALAAGLILLI